MADFRLGRLKFKWKGDWAGSTAYVIDDIVKFGANSYVCTTNHTSTANVTDWYTNDLSKWGLHLEGVKNVGDWAPNTFYKLNDVVKFGNTLYLVTTAHSSSSAFAASNFSEYVGGFQFEDSWSNLTAYQPGDVVSFGGYTYIAKQQNNNKQPNQYLNAPNDFWDVLTTGFSVIGDYSSLTTYAPGNVVQFGGYAYVAKTTTVGVAPNQLGQTSWDLVIKGFEWKGVWSSATTYYPGDVVFRSPSTYINILESTNNDPLTSSSNWELFTEGTNSASLVTQDQLNDLSVKALGYAITFGV